MTRVVLAEDSGLLRQGIATLLQRVGFTVAAQVGTADELLAAVGAERPDVALVDVRMPPTHTDEGIRAAQEIERRHPEVGVLILSQYVEPTFAMRLLEQRDGSRAGYLLKDHVTGVDTLARAVRTVAAGGSFVDPAVVERLLRGQRRAAPLGALSEREREILALMAEGRSNRGICERLYLSPKTVETHVRRIFDKLDLPPAGDDHRRVLAVLRHLRDQGMP